MRFYQKYAEGEECYGSFISFCWAHQWTGTVLVLCFPGFNRDRLLLYFRFRLNTKANKKTWRWYERIILDLWYYSHAKNEAFLNKVDYGRRKRAEEKK